MRQTQVQKTHSPSQQRARQQVAEYYQAEMDKAVEQAYMHARAARELSDEAAELLEQLHSQNF